MCLIKLIRLISDDKTCLRCRTWHHSIDWACDIKFNFGLYEFELTGESYCMNFYQYSKQLNVLAERYIYTQFIYKYIYIKIGCVFLCTNICKDFLILIEIQRPAIYIQVGTIIVVSNFDKISTLVKLSFHCKLCISIDVFLCVKRKLTLKHYK